MNAMFSIIIPTLNEERALPACLESLASQTLARELFEVIVIDNGSNDRTLQIARSYETRLPIQVFKKPNCSIAALRNKGVQEAQGELLAFLDADCVAPPHWLEFSSHLLAGEEGGVIGAGYRIPEASSWVAQAWYGSQNKKDGRVSYVPGGNLLVSRSDFGKAGSFDESLETSEDWEFCQRAASRGIKITAFPLLAVVHLGTPQTVREFYRKQYWHGTHALRAVLQSAHGWASGRAAWLAIWTLLSSFAFLMALGAWAFSGSMIIPAAGAIVLVAAPIILSSRSAFARGNILLLVPLTLLYLTYGFARAICLAGLTLPRPNKPAVPDSLVG